MKNQSVRPLGIFTRFSFFFCLFLFAALSSPAQWAAGGLPLTNANMDDQLEHRLSPMSNGNFYMSQLGYDAVGRIILNAFDPSGRQLAGWPAGGITISDPGGDYWKTELITTEDDHAIVVWYGYTTTGTGSDRRHILVQKYDDQGNALWNGGNSIQVSVDSFMHHLNPAIVSDGQNGVVIAWVQADLNFSPSSFDIYVQRIDSSGTVHAGWPGLPVVAASLPSTMEHKIDLALSPDGSSFYMAYVTGSINVSLYLMRWDLSDGTVWPGWGQNPGKSISGGPNIFPNAGREPKVFADSLNNAVTFWVEFAGPGEIMVQKTDPAGNHLFTASGYTFATIPGGDLTYPWFSMDENQRFNVAWRHSSGVDDVIHVNKMDLTGTKLWASDFVTTSNASVYPKVIPDGLGETYLFYKERTGGPDHLHAMRINNAGQASAGWALPGPDFGTIGNPNGTSPHWDFRAIALGNGTAVTVWDRRVNVYYDLYGCNVLPDGSHCVDTVLTGLDLESEGDFDPEQSSSSPLEIWPNPAKDILKLRSLRGSGKVVLIDAQGRLVHEAEVIGDEILQIPTGDLPAGIYFVLLQGGGKLIGSEKVVVWE